MKMNGGFAKADLNEENVDAVVAGCPNLGRHIENLKSFGVPVVVAINHFIKDTDAEIEAVKAYGLSKAQSDCIKALGRWLCWLRSTCYQSGRTC